MADKEEKKAKKPDQAPRHLTAEQAVKAEKDDRKAAKQARADKTAADGKGGKGGSPSLRASPSRMCRRG